METAKIENFNTLASKFSQLVYGRTEGDRAQINKTLDEINCLDYRYPVITNATKAVLLLHQCCTIIPPDDFQFVSKCCQLITNLVNRQHVQVEGQTLMLTVQWCLQAAKEHKTTVVEVLVALDGLLRSSVQNSHVLLLAVVNNNSLIITLAQDETFPKTVLTAVQCLEACTIPPDRLKNRTKIVNVAPQLEACASVFLKYLTQDKVDNFDTVLYCKLLILCIRGLQNVIVQNPEFLAKELELLLGISKTYMVFGVRGIQFVAPQKVMPSILNIAEPSTYSPKDKKGGKITKQRKHRVPATNKKDPKKSDGSEDWTNNRFCGYVPATATLDAACDNAASQLQFGIARLKTSDSDLSDNESGRAARLGIVQGRVRQAALSHLLQIIKSTDKHTIFCYWSSLIPDGSPGGIYNLATCILKDPSPKGRLGALYALLDLLASAKLYLTQAESSEKCTAYTPFSVMLGSMVKELHKSLILALNENSIPVLTQVLKCLAALVQATPYHRLTPGLITKVIRNVKIYIRHRDCTVQVAALIVLGCVLASEPLVPETKEALLKQSRRIEAEKAIKSKADLTLENDIEYVDFSSDEEENVSKCDQELPWLLERCLSNLGVCLAEKKVIETVPAPVKLESLQIISAMSRNYFDCLMAPYLPHITKALDECLCDKYADLRLHAGRTIDFIGQAMNMPFNTIDIQHFTIEQGFTFWQTLINSSSLTLLLQCEQHSVLRAVGCDCIGSIGPRIFQHFPRDKQILMVTLLFACSRDEENNVRAAAVRALAICVLYPSLREDSGFVVDVAEVVYRTLHDESLPVRSKASWSLGNLSDALVLNNADANVEDIPDRLLLQLLEISVKIAGDNDKIKVNCVRALGNLLQLVTKELMNQKSVRDAVGNAIDVLVKTSTTGTNMKVRWNSCHAIGNILKINALYPSGDGRRHLLFSSMMDLAMGFRNFKVRINAAQALTSPSSRELYGQHFYVVWAALLKALENTQNVEDFSEYNHRDHLIEEICLALGHMTTLLTVEDLSHVHDDVIFHLDSFKLQTHRVLERLIPEKSSILLFSVTHLNELMQTELSVEQTKTVKILLDIFTNDFYV